jgi:hypothetical protein
MDIFSHARALSGDTQKATVGHGGCAPPGGHTVEIVSTLTVWRMPSSPHHGILPQASHRNPISNSELAIDGEAGEGKSAEELLEEVNREV